MKVLLVNPPWQRDGRWGVRAGSRWPHIKDDTEGPYLPFPFLLAYAAALLKRHGHDVLLVDAIAEEMPASLLARRVSAFGPEVIIAETATASLTEDLLILRGLKRDARVFVAGPEAQLRDPAFLAAHEELDGVLVGEYEWTALDLVTALAAGGDLTGVAGLVVRERSAVRATAPRPLHARLDDLPWPLREGLPMYRYHDCPGGIPSPSVQLWASRGCPYECTFCLWPQVVYGGKTYRVRGVVDVADEMEAVVNTFGFRSVYFDDDTFNISRPQVMALAEELIHRRTAGRLLVPWAAMCRADHMDEALLERLRLAGLQAVKYGLESGVQTLVDAARKRLDLEKAARMIRTTQSLGIEVHLTFMFGLPGETWDSVRQTIAFALALNPSSVQFSITTPFPGTRYFSDLEQTGDLLSKVWADYDGNTRGVLRTAALAPRDLEAARLLAVRTWGQHVRRRRPGRIRTFVLVARRDGWRVAVAKTWRFLVRWLVGRPLGVGRWRVLRDTVGRFGVWDTVRKVVRYLHPHSTWQRAAEMAGILTRSRAFTGPRFAHVDLTNACNSSCVGCWSHSPLLGERRLQGEARAARLPGDVVRRVVDELARLGTQEIAFVGGGEPLMHPEALELIAYVKRKGLRCYLHTNFTLADEVTVRRLLAARLDHLLVSVWAGQAMTYCATHPGLTAATFERVCDLLRLVASAKRRRQPLVKMCHVVVKPNHQEVVGMFELAVRTGCEVVEFCVLDSLPGLTDGLLLDREELRRVLVQCGEIEARVAREGLQHRIELSNFNHFTRRLRSAGALRGEYDSDVIHTFPCTAGWTFTRIQANGDVNACLKSHRVPVGNIHTASFREIWHGARQAEFRRRTCQHEKRGVFFRDIGNDPEAPSGCARVCDDLLRNERQHERLEALSAPERLVLGLVAHVAGRDHER